MTQVLLIPFYRGVNGGMERLHDSIQNHLTRERWTHIAFTGSPCFFSLPFCQTMAILKWFYLIITMLNTLLLIACFFLKKDLKCYPKASLTNWNRNSRRGKKTRQMWIQICRELGRKSQSRHHRALSWEKGSRPNHRMHTPRHKFLVS